RSLNRQLGRSLDACSVPNCLVTRREHQEVVPVRLHQRSCFFEIGDCLSDTPLSEKHSSDFTVDLPRIGIKLERRSDLPLSLFCLALLLEISGFDAMGFGEPRVYFESALGSRKPIFVPPVGEPQLK